MTNIALDNRTSSFIASACLLTGVDMVERCGVVFRRSEYTVSRHVPVQSPLIATHDVRRVVFLVRLDGGIGSEMVTIDQTLDATSALIKEGDQVLATLVDDVHVESTIAPIFPWMIANGSNVNGEVLRRGEYLNSNGHLSTALLVLAAEGLVVTSPKAEPAREEVVERCGVILRRSEYTLERHVSVTSPLINTKNMRRVVFVLRLDGGIGSEGLTIDQTLDATSALLQEGDQVMAKIVDNLHVESTVQPFFAWGKADECDASAISRGRVLRTGRFLNSKGAPSVASLVLTIGQSCNLVVDVQAG